MSEIPHEELMLRSPAFFRKNLIIDIQDRGKEMLGNVLEPWQKRDFDAIDPCLMWLADRAEKKPKQQRFYWQRARGHSKTSDVAACLTWLLYSSRRGIRGIAGAEDKEQARLVRDSMTRIASDNPWLHERLDYKNYEVSNRHTGAMLTIVSSDVSSSWGYTPDFTFCDEFTHWSKPAFWHSLFSSFAKKNGMLIVACNAGMGRDWKWSVREAARLSPLWHFSAPKGCQASWFTVQNLKEQRSMLPPAEYLRLWENEWQETGGEFVTLAESQACCDKGLQMQPSGVNGWQYVAAIDFAEKRDYLACAIGHIYDKRIIIDRMDTVVPKPDRPNKVSFVRNWMQRMHDGFGNVRFIIDKYQLLGLSEELLELGYEIEEFDFGSGNGNYEMGMALRQCILHEKVVWYPGCGKLSSEDAPWSTPENPDDLEHELASLVVEPYSNGRRWRFNHLPDDTHHDDRAFVLGAIVLHCVKGRKEGYGYFDLTPPDGGNNFQWNAA